MHRGDTIAAISSSVGPAARMILRLSGPAAFEVAKSIGVPPDLRAAVAARIPLSFDGFTFRAWVYAYRSPRSYTGDDLIELHIPGNPLLASRLLDHLLRRGARAAEPGEFTARAFFNGRMDLSTAEGVATLIGAGNDNELQAGRQLMAGELAHRLTPILAALKQTLALVEVGIDFSQEDVTVLAAEEQAARIADIDAKLQKLLGESSRFARMSHEPRVVLVGRPNAGKSTLLNALTGRDRAVVSPVAGTTRDALSARVALPRGFIQLTDVAGVEESTTTNVIDQLMQSQAMRTLVEADLVIYLQSQDDPQPPVVLVRSPDLIVTSKIDLAFSPSSGIPREGWGGGSSLLEYRRRETNDAPALEISAKTGAGMHRLLTALDAKCFGDLSSEAGVALNVRHVRAIETARDALARTTHAANGELVAADLRLALDALGTILGQVSPDDVLGEIFSGFCIGK